MTAEQTEADTAAVRKAKATPWLSSALQVLASDLTAELSMADIAAVVNLSKTHFFSSFRRCIGQTPHQWRLKVRIAAAQADLIELPLCMAEIAQKYGFSDQAHFTRSFRQIVGETPGSWRIKNRQDRFGAAANSTGPALKPAMFMA
ncbi:helix-turn-helix domain-containing protein [Burkholderia catarinensis]|uniref:helix-turn-helix domain-containing protein n=1 Tax=Burkholderia catarinensis TaxID=1108140 RepID=UPI00100844D5|nr:AraC family transcriptional regulator [Burkholderia catarinensis]KAG8153760.1 hypothetical protein BFF94_010865 [Burkholderia catarinensis]